jgi:3,4-dihydroxy 2-butanone 4-phosphate synthase
MSQRTHGPVERAVGAFADGDPVLVHDADDREAETDILYPAATVAPADVARLRNDGGGLVFVAFSAGVADAFELPFLHELLDHPTNDHSDLGYDTHPSFSLPVNHRDTYTGITDRDRSLTITRLAAAAADPGGTDFPAEFRTPGHVHVLRAAQGLLDERRGHTELGVALAEAAGVAPAVAGCEMLDDDSGGALPKSAAQAYADRHGLVFVEGSELVAELA